MLVFVSLCSTNKKMNLNLDKTQNHNRVHYATNYLNLFSCTQIASFAEPLSIICNIYSHPFFEINSFLWHRSKLHWMVDQKKALCCTNVLLNFCTKKNPCVKKKNPGISDKRVFHEIYYLHQLAVLSLLLVIQTYCWRCFSC